MKFLSPLLCIATLSVVACAQEKSESNLRSGASAGLDPRSPADSAAAWSAPARPPRVPAQYNSVDVSRRIVALTFDDGPHPELTPKLLDILRQNGVRATFYVIGRNVATYPDIARRIVAEGHEIANHSYNHPALTSLGAERLNQEIAGTSDAIERATGRRPTNMRPPYGAINDRVRQAILRVHGLDVILWSCDPLDWKRPGAAVVRQRLVDGATPGGILLAHDIHPGTIEAVPGIIQDLKAKGYGFATVSQLLALRETKAAPASAEVANGRSAVQ
ncbi:MAG: polysaccharide deacetylase family protein [Chthoniobacterales bacterium]|nr:polysaccharide deacetylase family protein [Chthoniobacterales bacterium]